MTACPTLLRTVAGEPLPGAGIQPAVAIERPVLMPVWMAVAAVVILLVVVAWLVRTFIVTRRDTARAVRDIPMAPMDRRGWASRVEQAGQRLKASELDLRGLHLELGSILRGFASARCGQELEAATSRDILVLAGARPEDPIAYRLTPINRVSEQLDSSPLTYVGELLAVWEQPSFDRDPRAAAREALDRAREVVQRW